MSAGRSARSLRRRSPSALLIVAAVLASLMPATLASRVSTGYRLCRLTGKRVPFEYAPASAPIHPDRSSGGVFVIAFARNHIAECQGILDGIPFDSAASLVSWDAAGSRSTRGFAGY